MDKIRVELSSSSISVDLLYEEAVSMTTSGLLPMSNAPSSRVTWFSLIGLGSLFRLSYRYLRNLALSSMCIIIVKAGVWMEMALEVAISLFLIP
ncbi:hypothetical protein MANES_03G056201v8 [Manihot esculenta]|uniref:Uncharacterized protein n=1 Tax=Manihot esculenta TaxID=3983 RepID=A0ACB7HYR5_MANES|nr:hypothetical protein MANES_03G056201v8 [Manihot esculenta]